MIVLHYHADKKFDRTDPTGTALVRRNFRGQARLRWQRISVLTKDMLVTNDMLALKGGGLSTIHQPAVQGGATKIDIFQRWFDLTLNTILLNLNGDFMKPLLDEAYAMGETFGQDRMQTTNRNPMAAQRLLTLQKLAFIEMQGIIEAASQQSVRAVANGLLHNRTPSQISALADMLVVKSFNEAALDVYEAAGLTHVGVLAEMRARFMAVDARAKGPGSRISRTETPSKRTIQRIQKAARELERRLGRSVAIRTAGDDDVCPICEDIEEDGPYPIDTARSLIPAHPHCRCAFVPVMDRRYAETDDSYNPDQPRDLDGKWTSLGSINNSEGEEYGISFHEDPDRMTYQVKKGEVVVGTAEMAGRKSAAREMLGPYVGNVTVQSEHRGKGLASNLYSYIEKHQNVKLKPSPGYQSPAGKALWAKRSTAKDRISEVRVSDDYNPSQPRDPAGTSTGGQWTGGSAEAGEDPNSDIRAAIKAYTSSGGEDESQATPKQREEFLEWLKRGNYEGEVHRGIAMNEKQWGDFYDKYIPENMKQGDAGGGEDLEFKSITSWTKDKSRRAAYGGGSHKILFSTKSLKGRDISKFSHYKVEQEVAAAPQKFIVTGWDSEPGSGLHRITLQRRD